MICEECGCEMVQQEGCERCPACGEGPACGGVTIHPSVDVGSAGVPGAGVEPALREGDDAQRPDGGQPPRLPDGAPLPEDLARLVGVIRGLADKSIERTIRAHAKYGTDWLTRDNVHELGDELADAVSYLGMFLDCVERIVARAALQGTP